MSVNWYGLPIGYKMGVLPIISLKDGLQITSGDGTETSPYEISI